MHLNLFGTAFSKPIKPVPVKFISKIKKGPKKKVGIGRPKEPKNCLEFFFRLCDNSI